MSVFKSLGEQLLAIHNAAVQPGNPGPLVSLRAAAGAGEKVPADGGFAVESQFVHALIERLYLTGEIMSRCSEMPITAPNSNGVKFPQFSEDSRANGSRLGGVTANWAEEGVAPTASHAKVMLSELKLQKLIANVYVSDELVADAGALETFTATAFGQEMTFRLEDAIVAGLGAPQGQPLGILNSNALIQVPKESGQASASVVAQNVVKMAARLWAPSRKRAIFLYNQELLPQLLTLVLPVSAGSTATVTSLFEFSDGTDDSGPWDRLCGMPAIPSEHCPVVGTTGDLLLCDLSRYILARREQLIEGAVSIHVRFITDESAFRFTMRVDGQPFDRAPVSPLNGSNTTSPFVALAPR